jgi:hypothetical protein
MRILTDEDATGARVLTRVWRWRIYAMVVTVVAVLLLLLISKT